MTPSHAVAAIEAKGLAIGYSGGQEAHVLSGVDLTVRKGEFITILGPSGCGKSTFLRAVADLLDLSEGQLTVLGKSPAEARKNREVAFVFQDATLLPWRTVRQNVALPLQVGRNCVTRLATSRPDDWLELVGLSHLADRYPDQLSGGQRQRVAIARALQCEPDILLMDEPFGALDEITRERLNDELLNVWERTGATVLFVTHSISEAIYLGGRVLVLAANPGRVRAIVDLAALKDATGRADRQNEDVYHMANRLRELLHQGNTA